MNIVVAGSGYVGLSISTLLARHNRVTSVDVIKDKVDEINKWQSPIQDEYIEKFFRKAASGEKALNLHAVWNNGETGSDNPSNDAYASADFVVIAAPTNYDSKTQHFDTSAVESVIDQAMGQSSTSFLVIKSTIAVGYTEAVRKKYKTNRILFSPEFLRESKALYDNLYPSRIIVGWDEEDPDVVKASETFAKLLSDAAEKKDVPVLHMGFTEAEAVKLLQLRLDLTDMLFFIRQSWESGQSSSFLTVLKRPEPTLWKSSALCMLTPS